MDIGCNRLENAVKPQPASDLIANAQSCNRLENAVKPQQQLSMEFPEKVVTD